MPVLTRAAIEAANPTRTADVEVPEWGGSVRLRSMTIGEQTDILRGAKDASEDGLHQLFRVVAACAVDESGAPLWASEAEVRGMAGGPGFRAVQRLFTAAMELNNLTESAEKN